WHRKKSNICVTRNFSEFHHANGVTAFFEIAQALILNFLRRHLKSDFQGSPRSGAVFEATLSVFGKIQKMPKRKNFKLFEADRPSF
ncbi:MAG: hypothetical protein K9J85_11045, partial [Desulfobacteraceae bacterium]|nr:hypothetical protein [Desulfobacteraceae bacterium]